MLTSTAFLSLLIIHSVFGGIFDRDFPKVPFPENPSFGEDIQIPAEYEFEPNFEKSAVAAVEAASEVEQSELRMPGVTLNTNETYLCSTFQLDLQDTHYLLEFEALADAKHVHHIILFGCDEPGNDAKVWDCGEMTANKNSEYQQSPVCKNNPEIIFSWGKNAPKLELPEGVGYPVGGRTKNQNLILQVHYMHEESKEDYSGLRIVSTIIPQPRTAATLLIVTGGTVKAHTTVDFEAACVMDEPIVMHPFAFRVHTHSHGVNVAGYIVNEDAMTKKDEWFLIGERNPQLSQMFAPVSNKSAIIQPGDIIASRCTMKNDENRDITVGSTGADEMCNFYIYYMVEGTQTLKDNTCYSPGYPEYRWSTSAGLNNIPKHHH
jgi:peptidylglycine monooxygenase